MWARVANHSVDHLSRRETREMLTEAGQSAGLAIVFGNILDTIPGCLVIGRRSWMSLVARGNFFRAR